MTGVLKTDPTLRHLLSPSGSENQTLNYSFVSFDDARMLERSHYLRATHLKEDHLTGKICSYAYQVKNQ
jgi:hypothetical protein